jgi:hypothetical protein
MRARLYGWCGITAAALIAGCKSDPTASLSGQPVALSITPKQFALTAGATLDVSVRILDATFASLPGTVVATSSSGSIATVGPSATAKPDPTGTLSVFTVQGVAAAASPAYIRFTGGGLKDSAQVTVQ